MVRISAEYPKRIICLAEEFTETLYLLGRDDLIAGISGFTVRPPEARKTKPKVCTFIEANYEKIYSLKPDLIFAFSDLQAEIVKELVRNGMNVFCFNQRSISDILSMMRTIGAIIGENKKSDKLVSSIEKNLKKIYASSQKIKLKPKIYFEEWDEPMISGIQWVEEIIEVCGGETIFPELRYGSLAKDRFVKPEDVIKRNPDIILASWCGKGVKINKIKSRLGWENINAVKNNKIYEIKSSIILQPGPASLTDGVKTISEIIQAFNA
jgi:iron complex transport system substrate-binding protein